MDFAFQAIFYDASTFLDEALPSLPKASAVYKIFDTHGRLIVLDKTSNLFQRLERYFGIRSEKLKDLDLRLITSRIEFIRTFSPFETAYVLYLERRRLFPKTYRKMRTFRLFTLMKINKRQRFPRIYATREIKPGTDYFGPFLTRSQFTRLKTALERAFKLRPCLYNIRGNDPHPDCMYFQMHTCSRPCNNDIDRPSYLEDVDAAIAFIQGHDEEVERPALGRMEQLAAETRFEDAEALRRHLERLRRARQETKETFASVWDFNYLVVAPSENSTRRRIAFVRAGSIVGFEDYAVERLKEVLANDLSRMFGGAAPQPVRAWQYDEFCLVCNFLIDPLATVDLVPFSASDDFPAVVERRIEELKKARKKKKQAIPFPNSEDQESND